MERERECDVASRTEVVGGLVERIEYQIIIDFCYYSVSYSHPSRSTVAKLVDTYKSPIPLNHPITITYD